MTSKRAAQRQKHVGASYFEKMREVDALILTISAGLRQRSFEQKLNGGDNVTAWSDVGDIASFVVTLRDLNDRVNKLGEYA